jgi:peptidoglycan/xylan/chitin deacetylase (PgdA/CDA1 family)
MQIATYHYVRQPDPGLPFFRFLHVEDFRAQLDYFQRRFRMVSREAFLAAMDGGPLPDNGMVLTFDDGLREHYEIVLPELEARGLWGLFFVSTGPLEEGNPLGRTRMLRVHRLHHLLGVHGGRAVRAALEPMIEEHMADPALVAHFKDRVYPWQNNDDATGWVKRMLNYFLAERWRDAVLDRLCSALLDEPHWAERLYLTAPQAHDMQRRGMLVGSHAVSHPVMSLLPAEEQRREIESSFAMLEQVTGGLLLRCFCYPYGTGPTYTKETERLLSEAGCRCAFIVEPRPLEASDLRDRPQALPRYDCNMFPHGAASLGSTRPAAAVTARAASA